jgi:hypothetical protein
MKLRLLAFLLKRTGLRSWAYGQLGSDIDNIARYAPSAWNNKDQVTKRKLYVLLGGPDRSLDGWRR